MAILISFLCWFRACSLNRNILVQSRTIEPAKKYSVHQLVYYEDTNDIYAALQREKQLKNLSSCKRGWNRKWKLALIEKINPDWNDLAKDWIPAKSMRE